MATADEVIIAVNPQLLAMMGLQDFLRTVMKIKRRINPKLDIAGTLLTMCEKRTALCKVLTEEVTENFREQIRVFETQIPSTVKEGEVKEKSVSDAKMFAQIKKKYFKGKSTDEIMGVLEQALSTWFDLSFYSLFYSTNNSTINTIYHHVY